MKKLLFIVLLFSFIKVQASEVKPYTFLNTDKNDYAITFRSTCDGMEVWLTNNKPNSHYRSRRIVVAKVDKKGIHAQKEQVFPINQEGSASKVILDGSPTFSACNPNYGVFTSNRLYNGKFYDNDLYEIHSYGEGIWEVKRLDKVNSSAWDDTPCLSPDGNFLYFASDRNQAGAGGTDLFVSQRQSDGNWGKPKELTEITSPKYNEQTPMATIDGYLYYATNKTGDYDIWRVELNSNTGRPIAGTEEPIPFKGVNKVGTNEADPSFSPGQNWFIFSSDGKIGETDKNIKDRDLYYLKVKDGMDKLYIKSLLRTKEFNKDFDEFEDVAVPLLENIKVEDLFSGESAIAMPDENGMAVVELPYNSGVRPDQDRRIREVLVFSTERILSYETAHDTLIYEVGQECRLEHTLFIWDSKIFESPDCSQNFPITNVEFFITGYWCPTTKRYRHLTPCQSVFCEDDCFSVPTITQPCADNDLYNYRVEQAKVTRSRKHGLCADLSEVDAHGDEWSDGVDNAITLFVDKMKSALKNPCITRSIRKGKAVNVEVIGWTDPRPISKSCLYTGEDIDILNSDIILKDIDKKSYLPNGILKNGTPFAKSGSNGNQLLSEIRAYNTALLLDSLWKLMIPDYATLREKNIINVIAVGKAVSQQKIRMEKQRSVNVRVSSELAGELLTLDDIADLGRSVALCGNDCLENLICRDLERTSTIALSEVEVIQPIKTEEAINTVVLSQSKGQEATNQLMIENLPKYFAIQFFSSEDEEDATIIAKKLVSRNLENVRVVTYRNIQGILFYKVLYNRYADDGEAKVYVGTDGLKLARELELRMPLIVTVE